MMIFGSSFTVDELAEWNFDQGFDLDSFCFLFFEFFSFVGSTGLKNHLFWTSTDHHISTVANTLVFMSDTHSQEKNWGSSLF
jgi:hypothetical protein